MSCLPILLILSSCGKQSGKCDPVPATLIKEAETHQLMDKVQSAAKPFTVVNFYATWCKPCRMEMPELVAMGKDPASHASLLLVSVDEEEKVKSELPRFLGCSGVDFESFYKSKNPAIFVKEFFPSWNDRIPLSLIYARNGELVSEVQGVTSREEIEMIINQYETKHGDQ